MNAPQHSNCVRESTLGRRSYIFFFLGPLLHLFPVTYGVCCVECVRKKSFYFNYGMLCRSSINWSKGYTYRIAIYIIVENGEWRWCRSFSGRQIVENKIIINAPSNVDGQYVCCVIMYSHFMSEYAWSEWMCANRVLPSSSWLCTLRFFIQHFYPSCRHHTHTIRIVRTHTRVDGRENPWRFEFGNLSRNRTVNPTEEALSRSPFAVMNLLVLV